MGGSQEMLTAPTKLSQVPGTGSMIQVDPELPPVSTRMAITESPTLAPFMPDPIVAVTVPWRPRHDVPGGGEQGRRLVRLKIAAFIPLDA